MADLLGSDFALAECHRLYEVHDHLLAHKAALFSHLQERWRDLFNAKFEVLLYDLTSTYFESDPPFPEKDKRQFGYSRDKRGDCVQVVIALILRLRSGRRRKVFRSPTKCSPATPAIRRPCATSSKRSKRSMAKRSAFG